MSHTEELDPNNWNSLAPHFAALLAIDLFPAGVHHWLRRWSDLEKIVWEARARLKQARSWDVTNPVAQQAFNDFTVGTFAHFQTATQQLKAKLLSIPTYRPAPPHIELLHRWRNESDLFRPVNVPLQAQIDVLANSYDGLVRAIDERSSLSDSTETTWRQRNQHWLERREQFDQLFLELLRLRRQLAQNAGLPDYRAYRWREMGRLDYTPDSCRLFHEAVATQLVPVVQQLSARRRDKQHVMRRPWETLRPADTDHQAVFATTAAFEAGMAHVFTAFDPYLGTLFTKMRAGFLDLGTRAGKAGGGEEWFFPLTGLPYVRMDSDGTVEGISLLLHECGHAFHDFLSSSHQELIWNVGGPTEFEEFAAIALTYLALPHLHQQGVYSAAEMAQVLANQIEEAIMHWVPHIAHVDAFQHWVYAEAPENVQPADLDAQWDALAQRFQPDIDWTGLTAERALGWQQVGLLFQVPFYYLEYALAHLGALQIWQKMRADPEATWQAYRAALALGNTRPLRELYEIAGARLPFNVQIVSEVVQAVADYLDNRTLD